jgi:hypothetical protein
MRYGQTTSPCKKETKMKFAMNVSYQDRRTTLLIRTWSGLGVTCVKSGSMSFVKEWIQTQMWQEWTSYVQAAKPTVEMNVCLIK